MWQKKFDTTNCTTKLGKNLHISAVNRVNSPRDNTGQLHTHHNSPVRAIILPDSKDLIRSWSKGAAYSHTSSSFHLKPFQENTQIQTESRSWSEGTADVREIPPVGCTRMTCARVSDWANSPQITSIRPPPASTHVTTEIFQVSWGAGRKTAGCFAPGAKWQVNLSLSRWAQWPVWGLEPWSLNPFREEESESRLLQGNVRCVGACI